MNDTPATWAWATMGEITQHIQRGKSPKYASHSALPVINQKCIRWDELQLQHLKYIHPDHFDKWDASRHIRPGDILWNSTGTGTVGRAYLVREADCTSPKVVDSHVTIVRPASAIEPRYLFNWIKSPAVQYKIEEMCDGTTNQIELSRTAIAATAIPIPPHAEQARIADQLDTLLTRVNACNGHLDAIPGILKRFRQAVLNAAVSGRLTADWRESRNLNAAESGEGLWSVPAEWRWAEAKDECGFITKGTTPSKEKMTSGGGQVPYIKVYNLDFDGALDFTVDPTFVEFRTHAVELKRSIVLPGDVLMNIVGPPLGKVSVVPDSYPEWNINQAIARFRPGPNLRSEFLAYGLLHSDLVAYAVARSKATAGQWNLTLEICRALPIPIPSLAEQDEIIRRLKSLMLFAGSIEARHTALRTHAQRLAPQVLAKAFRGELVEQDPQDEPASVLLERLATSMPTKAAASRERPRAQPKPRPSAPDRPPTDWASLPVGAWAAPADPDGHAVAVWLTAVLRAWRAPMPERSARMATLLCQQPHLFTSALPAAQARLWSRLVGDAAAPLPAQVARLQPASNHPWGRALQGMRMRGDLIEAETGDHVTWALGPGAAAIDTAGWPDVRAGFVVVHLRAHGLASVLPALAPAEQAFVDARAA